jgi:GAF domain-containing protein/HAMP domain-containing protein
MAKTQKPSEEEKIVKENVKKRFKNMFTGENEPLSNMSLREAEALKARVAELEEQLGERPAAPVEHKPVEAVAEPLPQPVPQFPLEARVKKIRTDQREPLAPAALEKLIGSWVTGISAAISLAFFGVALYIVFVLQSGMMELSDKVLMPYTVLMVIANLIGLRLVRHNRTPPGVWISYLTNVIVGPVLVVLVIKNFHFIMGGYLVFFSLLFITLVLPKTSRWWASLAAVGAALVIAGIEAWNPAFRLSTSHIQNFPLMILGPAALGLFLLFNVARQLRYPQATRSLTAILSIAIFALSVVLLLINGGAGAFINYTNYQETLSARQSLIAQDASKTVINFIQEKFGALETAVGLGNPAVEDPEKGEEVLASLLGLQPALKQAVLLDSTGQQLASISRQSSSLSPQFESHITEDVRAQTKAGQRYIGPIYIDDATSEPQVVIAVPVRNSFGDFQGTLAAELNLKFMWDLVGNLEVGKTGYAYVVDYQGNLIAAGDPARVLRGENVKQIFEVKQFLKDPWYQVSDITPGLVSYEGLRGENVVGNYVPLITPTWAVFTELPTREAYQPVIQSLLTSGFMILVFGIVAGLAGNFLARRLSAPLTELSRVATEISSGNLGLQAKVSGPTEIEQVASTFNAMTRQLHDLIGSLEQRVSDRTHDLELAAEVGRTITARVAQLSEMLSESVETIRARFDLYYTQIYLIDPSGEKITLRAGTGEAGKQLLQRGHSLIIGPRSLNGRAVLEKQAQIVPDTTANPAFLPNPLLPKTRSEMCVPLIVGTEVIGVLDMQSEQRGAFSENNLPAFEALAGQLAIAIRNAALFAEVQETRLEVEAQVNRFTEQGWDDFLNAIHEGHKIGFAFDGDQAVQLNPEALSTSNADHLNLPIAVAGTKVGEIQLPVHLKPNELELVKAISEQLAQQVENLRLLARAETFRKEAEQALRRLTHEGWETYLDTTKSNTAYAYDLNQVQPVSEDNVPQTDQAFKQPLVIRGQTIGELKLDLQDTSAENLEIVSAVAQQLSGHLETLRLSELNEKHAQREQTLRQLTSTLRSSTNPTTIMRTAVREVGRILGRRTVVQVLSPEQTNQAESVQGNGDQTDSPADRS